MKYEKIRFGDLYAIGSRNGLSKPSKVRGLGYKMINMGELFANDRIYDIPMELVPLKEKEKINAKVEAGDLLFARQSLVLEGAGKCSIVMEVSPLTVFESHLIRVRLLEEANPSFYYYYFRSALSPIKSIVSQCAQAGIRGSDLQELCVLYPPKKTQDRIANILEQYDNLIENNQKQIKLLEEAAQRLYKEWFVDLHFPGYEDVEIVDGVPEGWTEGTLEDVAPFKRGKTITKVQVHDGDVPVVAGGLEPAYYHNVSNTVAPVITVSGSGANAGYARLYNVNVFASDCSFVDSNSTPYLFYVYCFIKDNKDRFNALKKGSAQPHVYAKDINALEALIPTNKLIEEFCSIASQYFEKIKILQMQIQLSTQARDRLLPKLMSGEIEV
jgi:hypothetical protein